MPALEPELLSRLMPTYVKAREDDLRKLRTALNTGDFHLLGRLAHKIKGSAGTYGFDGTAATARQLEAAAHAGDLALCASYIKEMEASLFKA